MIAVHCPDCGASVELPNVGLASAECPTCQARFSAAVAFLRERGKAIDPIGDATAPFETPYALARAAELAVKASQSIGRNRRFKSPGWDFG